MYYNEASMSHAMIVVGIAIFQEIGVGIAFFACEVHQGSENLLIGGVRWSKEFRRGSSFYITNPVRIYSTNVLHL